MLEACYFHEMSNLQVKDVPKDLHRKIRAYAKNTGRTIRDVVLTAVLRELERDAFFERWETRTRVKLNRKAADTLNEVRREREELQ